ncbi:nucleotide exchange factor GrpE [Pseudobutyrivibrio xylanivorans]|uniref:Nucleotide exchange factor GrpE n=1 Tax=Pseudobutyrivibrio xylanivorans TaxID=185007 RepID=A0A5P6VRL0_PSEXY|nr:nucleotide exchange factor GrpE [Pseudobutyrivibrio xylanivorans]QFJ54339.1 nucleotide exchange factor GrpE [Pseudobutyrivibrio xylanivorans]
MGVFNHKNKQNNNSDFEGDGSEKLILQNNEILNQLQDISNKIDTLDKSNKKFLMSASINKTEYLEQRIKNIKNGIIGILDNVDILALQMKSIDNENIQAGIDMVLGELKKEIHSVEIKEIEVKTGDKFDPDFHNCIETYFDDNYQEDTILSVRKKGYLDLDNNLVIRTAEVVVNKR